MGVFLEYYNQSRYYNQCYTSHVIEKENCIAFFHNMCLFYHPLIVYNSNMQNLDFGAFQSQSEGANVEWDNPLM